MPQYHIRVTQDIRERIQTLAAKRGQAALDLIRQFIADGLNRMEKECKR